MVSLHWIEDPILQEQVDDSACSVRDSAYMTHLIGFLDGDIFVIFPCLIHMMRVSPLSGLCARHRLNVFRWSQ